MKIDLAGRPAGDDALRAARRRSGDRSQRAPRRPARGRSPPGGETALDIVFHDQLPRVIARTGYFDQLPPRRAVVPQGRRARAAGRARRRGRRAGTSTSSTCTREFYADWGSYDLELVAPKGFTVGAVGARIGEPRETPGGRRPPLPPGRRPRRRVHAVGRLRAAAQGRLRRTGEPPRRRRRCSTRRNGSARGASRCRRRSTRSDTSRETLGPYPYKTVTVVVPPFNARESGGMEYETFFTTIGGGKVVDPAVRYVTVHEFGHGYFMGLLASNEFEEPFLDEGMNEWWDTRMLEGERAQVRLRRCSAARLPRAADPHLGLPVARAAATRRLPVADPIAGNSWHRMSRAAATGSVYARTGLVMHDLEKRLGGDAIARGMKLYYARWHHRHPSTADLREALAEASGQPEVVREVFESQVFRNDPIDDRVVTVESDGDGAAARDRGRGRQAGGEGRGDGRRRRSPPRARTGRPSTRGASRSRRGPTRSGATSPCAATRATSPSACW